MIMESADVKKLRAYGGNGELYSERDCGDVKICRLNITSSEEAREYSCSVGRHVTLYTGKLCELDEHGKHRVAEIISQELGRLAGALTDKCLGGEFSVLVAGIGNRSIAADALGPLTADKLSVTRHVKKLNPRTFDAMRVCCVSALSCGVMGMTGIEAAELLAGAVSRTKPDLVVAVDALAAKECARLDGAVQLSDSGILPGAGIGNRRCAIDRGTLGVPVIAIGVPTVVSSSTLIAEAMKKMKIGNADGVLRKLLDDGKGFFVAPKECELIAASASDIIARAIDMTFVGI